MARIAGVNIPNHQHAEIALTAIYGIGRTRSQKICDSAGIVRSAKIKDLTEAESSELMTFTQKAIRVMKAISNPHAFNVGLNLGTSAGGSLADHLHMHVVPRWGGDANFITVIGGTKVIPQLLRDTRKLLADEWARQDSPS